VCLLTALLRIGIENNLTVATTLGLLFTLLSWSLKHCVVPRTSCDNEDLLLGALRVSNDLVAWQLSDAF